MKLLITTQAVDMTDPVLGFFHRWIEEFAKHCEKITVVCLREGNYQLPANVEVCSLSEKLKAESYQLKALRRLRIVMHFYALLWRKRRSYDAVFVHMNPEYIVLGGMLWKAMSKRIGLWYVHRSITLWLRIAAILADRIFTASPESFRIKSDKVNVIGHGIDTDFFKPAQRVKRGEIHALSAGRLSPSKRHDLVIEACALLPQAWQLTIAGAPATSADRNYETLLRKLVQELGLQDKITFAGGMTQTRMRDLYQTSDVLIHASETGSLDKVVLEALACGLPVISTNEAFKNSSLPIITCAPEPGEIVYAVGNLQASDPALLHEHVVREHGLVQCIQRIRALLEH